MEKYYVRFYKRDYIYIYLISKDFKKRFLTFSSFVSYIEENNIDFKSVKFNMNLNDLFYHFVDYCSIKRVVSYNNLQEDKKNKLKEVNRI